MTDLELAQEGMEVSEANSTFLAAWQRYDKSQREANFLFMAIKQRVDGIFVALTVATRSGYDGESRHLVRVAMQQLAAAEQDYENIKDVLAKEFMAWTDARTEFANTINQMLSK